MTQATEEIKKDDNWSEIGPEVLVEMSAKGEIDPWDVDLVYVIDKFLNKLADRQDKQELKEAARIIFFVSVLLKLKSQRIYQKPNNQPALGDDDFLDFENIDFEEFIIRKNIQLLPYLKEYNGKETDYDKLAELYYIARGSVSGKRFGF